MESRVRKTIRLSPSLTTQLEHYAKKEEVTETFVFEQALKQYFQAQSQEYDRIAERFLEKYEEKYKNYMTRVRLAAREADVNSQILLELANSLLFLNRVEGKDFVSIDEMEHPMLQKAKWLIKDRIARFKQQKDFQRYG